MEWSLNTYSVVLSAFAIVGLIALAVSVACLLVMIRDRRAEKKARGRG
jgi:hypothetical protein